MVRQRSRQAHAEARVEDPVRSQRNVQKSGLDADAGVSFASSAWVIVRPVAPVTIVAESPSATARVRKTRRGETLRLSTLVSSDSDMPVF